MKYSIMWRTSACPMPGLRAWGRPPAPTGWRPFRVVERLYMIDPGRDAKHFTGVWMSDATKYCTMREVRLRHTKSSGGRIICRVVRHGAAFASSRC